MKLLMISFLMSKLKNESISKKVRALYILGAKAFWTSVKLSSNINWELIEKMLTIKEGLRHCFFKICMISSA